MQGASPWNDSIGQFIRIKAQQPQIIVKLMKQQQEYHNQWTISRKIQKERKQYEQARRTQEYELTQLKTAIDHKQALLKQMSKITMDMRFLEIQADKQGWETQTKRESAQSYFTRDSLGNNQGLPAQMNPRKIELQKNFERKKQALMREVDALIQTKIELTQQKNSLQKSLNQLKQNKVQAQGMQELKESIAAAYRQNDQLCAKKYNLEQQLRKKENYHGDPRVRFQKQSRIVKQSLKDLNPIVKDMKKILANGENRQSKKFIEMKQSCQPYRGSLQVLLAQLHDLIKKHPQVHFIDQKSDGRLQHFGQQLDDYQTLLAETLKGIRRKDVTQQQYVQAEKIMGGVSGYLQQLMQRQRQMDEQIKMMKEVVDRKSRQIESEKKRLRAQTKI